MSLLLTLRRPAWMDHAACADSSVPDAVWLGDDTDPVRVFDAQCVCWRCPVFADCQRELDRQAATDVAGIWAGETDEQRRGRRGRPRKVA